MLKHLLFQQLHSGSSKVAVNNLESLNNLIRGNPVSEQYWCNCTVFSSPVFSDIPLAKSEILYTTAYVSCAHIKLDQKPDKTRSESTHT